MSKQDEIHDEIRWLLYLALGLHYPDQEDAERLGWSEYDRPPEHLIREEAVERLARILAGVRR